MFDGNPCKGVNAGWMISIRSQTVYKEFIDDVIQNRNCLNTMTTNLATKHHCSETWNINTIQAEPYCSSLSPRIMKPARVILGVAGMSVTVLRKYIPRKLNPSSMTNSEITQTRQHIQTSRLLQRNTNMIGMLEPGIFNFPNAVQNAHHAVNFP